MSTTSTTNGRISLRELARRLDVNHSALSTACHDGTLQAGIGWDAKGRVVVLDADAASQQWHATRTPRVDYLARRQAKRQLVSPAPPPQSTDSELYDRAMDSWTTAGELFRTRDALSALVSALVKHALADDPDPSALTQAIAARLREVADMHCPDLDASDLIEHAEVELEAAIELLRLAAAEAADTGEASP